MNDSTHNDSTFSTCNNIAMSLTECDHCHKLTCGFDNPVPNSPNVPLIKLMPSKNLVSTGFAPTVDITIDRPNVRYSPIAPPKPLPLDQLPYITIIPMHLHTSYLHNPLILHLHRTVGAHPTNQPIIPNRTPLTYCSYHPYYPHFLIPCYH